jgi:hypothetical protein
MPASKKVVVMRCYPNVAVALGLVPAPILYYRRNPARPDGDWVADIADATTFREGSRPHLAAMTIASADAPPTR